MTGSLVDTGILFNVTAKAVTFRTHVVIPTQEMFVIPAKAGIHAY